MDGRKVGFNVCVFLFVLCPSSTFKICSNARIVSITWFKFPPLCCILVIETLQSANIDQHELIYDLECCSATFKPYWRTFDQTLYMFNNRTSHIRHGIVTREYVKSKPNHTKQSNTIKCKTLSYGNNTHDKHWLHFWQQLYCGCPCVHIHNYNIYTTITYIQI